MKSISRRQFLTSIFATGVSATGYSTLVEPRWIEITRREVPLPHISRPVQLLHISDLHYSLVVLLSYLESAIEMVLAQQPDVVCITGDFTSTYISNEREYSRILRKLSDAAPVFACFGNHDGGKWAIRRGGYATPEPVRNVLNNAGITVLENAHNSKIINDNQLFFIGLSDWWANEINPPKAFAQLTPESHSAPKIVLSHNPDTKTHIQPFEWDLLLCGHTHGGQIRFPLIGAPFAPVRDKRFVEGLHRWENRWLHITRGIGNVRGIRINCRPEISHLSLIPTPNS
ncbi:MAG: phosphodiesterase YaeI [Calditrichaeota bacterium]|nr:phosphodiesterase YaeI [Calditrichota bacterium]